MSASTEVPLLRLTLVGSSGCGKTSLITRFVNNIHPVDIQATNGANLYYKVMRLPLEGEESQAVCIEIEDTYGSERIDGGRNIQMFLDMRRKSALATEAVNDLRPFRLWKPPVVPMKATDVYRPLTNGRMGFIFTFDAHDMASFDEVARLHDSFRERLDEQKTQLRPVVYFVATKIDKNPESTEFNAVITKAEYYAQAQVVRLLMCSSLTGKNVKKAFFDIIRVVLGNETLWEIEIQERQSNSDSDD